MKMDMLFPRSLTQRMGRKLYMLARGEVQNHMHANGEFLLQRLAIDNLIKAANRSATVYVCDVGANRGDWTAHLLACMPQSDGGPSVRTICFEPDPTAAAFLSRRFQGRAVCIEQMCLSNEPGKAIFYSAGPMQGTNSLYPFDAHQSQALEVKRETLDSYCQKHDIATLGLVKVDAEGHDFHVIKGALGMLQAGAIAILQFEYNYRWVYARNYLKDVFDLATALPYKVGKIQPHYVVIFDQWHYELERFFEGNYVLIHESALDWLPRRQAIWNRCNAFYLR